MKKYYRILIFTSLLGGSLLSSPVNNIDEDPWLRSWLFIGPFDNYEIAQKVSDSLSNKNYDDIKEYSLKNGLKDFTVSSNSSTGSHSIYQYFLEKRETILTATEKYVIGFSTILSNKNIDVLYKQIIHPNDRFTFILDNKLIVEKSNDWNYSELINLKRGQTKCRLISQLKGEQISFWWDYENSLSIGIFKDEYQAKISGVATHNGKNLPETTIELYNESGFHTEIKSDSNGKFEINLISSIVGETLDLYAYKDNLKFQKRIELKNSNKLNIGLTLKDYDNTINGKVVTLYKNLKQSDILVKLINLTNGKVLAKTFSDNSGNFSFERVPEGSYEIFVETAQGKFFYRDYNNINMRVLIGKGQETINEVLIKVPQINKGQWDQITFIKGLRSDMVFDVHIDNKNRIWYGCHTGLSVYDGNAIKNFGSREGLETGAVIEIFEDSKGLIWILQRNNYMGGGAIFTVDENYSIENFNEKYDLGYFVVNAIDEDRSGNIIFGGMEGLHIFDGKEIESFKYGDGIGSGFITDILVDGDFYWIGTSDGLVAYNGQNFMHYGVNEGLIGSTFIKKISKSKKGNLLISTGRNGWFRQNSGRNIFTKSIYEYDGLIFNNDNEFNHTPNTADFSFDDDLVIYNSHNKLLVSSEDFQQTISPYWAFEKSLGGYITSIDIARGGSIIVGTIGGGAWKYNGHSVYTVSSVDGIDVGHLGSGLIDNDGQLWNTSRDNGIIITKDGQIVKKLKAETGFPTNTVRALEIDSFGNIWAATNIGLINIVGNKYILHDKSAGFINNDMQNVSINENGVIWVSGFEFLSSMNGKNIQNYESDVDSILIFGGNSGLLALDDGSVLFGGPGLKKLIPDENGGKFYFISKSDHCNAITANKNGEIFYSSVGEGLVKLDNKDKKEVYNLDNGFKYEVPLTAHVDKNGWIWSSSESGGVALFDGEVWSYLTTDDGLLSNWVSSIASDDGKYYFTHGEGITIYNPLKLVGHVEIDKISTSLTDYNNNDDIESIVKERIQFSLSARNHNTSKDKNKFKCLITKKGQKVFEKISNNSTFEWYPEDSGEYIFSAQSIDQDLNYSNPKVLSISILNPWYIRSSFLIPFLGFLTVILYTAYYAMSKFIKQKEFNEKLRLNARQKDKEARIALEEKNKDLIESQKAAEAANEAKSTFLANMSHELRTPLNAIIGYSEMLIEDAEDENEDFIPDLDKINSSGKHLLGLINDILDLSKVESGKMELYIEEFDLQKTLGEIESTIKPLVEKNSNTFEFVYDIDVKSMKADVTKVRQILLNLLSNSSKFTKDGVIKVHVKDSDKIDQGVDFIIEDTGIGMSPDQVEKVFQPFTQADEKTTRKFGGTGLGLTITKMFAEMMDGSIDVKSIEGEGTTFIVRLPLEVIDKAAIISDESASVMDDDKEYTILVIDDDDNAQDMMKRFLEKQGYNIIQAKTGEMGLKLATEHMPDLITLDVMMPEMDGWEVLTVLQSNEISKKIPVIMLTMANEPDIGYSLGATDYLTKPVDWNELSSILSKHQIESDSQTVLIVEDDETTRQMLRKSLETNEYKVRTANNGKEALEKVNQFKPGLILLDLMMPEMDGFEFAEKLREKKEWMDIPVVVITAKDLTKEDLGRLKGNVESIMQKGSYSKNELLSEVGERIKKLKKTRK